jgi:hypothetical protein
MPYFPISGIIFLSLYVGSIPIPSRASAPAYEMVDDNNVITLCRARINRADAEGYLSLVERKLKRVRHSDGIKALLVTAVPSGVLESELSVIVLIQSLVGKYILCSTFLNAKSIPTLLSQAIPTLVRRKSDLNPVGRFDLMDASRASAQSPFSKAVSASDFDDSHSVMFVRAPGTHPDGVIRILTWLQDYVTVHRSIFESRGLSGYTVLADLDLIIEFLSWRSQLAMDSALATPYGQAFFNRPSHFSEAILFSTHSFDHQRLQIGQLYRVK